MLILYFIKYSTHFKIHVLQTWECDGAPSPNIKAFQPTNSQLRHYPITYSHRRRQRQSLVDRQTQTTGLTPHINPNPQAAALGRNPSAAAQTIALTRGEPSYVGAETLGAEEPSGKGRKLGREVVRSEIQNQIHREPITAPAHAHYR